MKETYFLAIDIGASSGRHILGHLSEGKLVIEEIYRFKNSLLVKDGHLVWDIKRLYKEILQGLKKAHELQKEPAYVGIDTWGVDYVLLDEKNQVLGNAYGYRDSRTQNVISRSILFSLSKTSMLAQAFSFNPSIRSTNFIAIN